MAPTEELETKAAKSARGPSIMVIAAVSVVAVLAGVAVPWVMQQLSGQSRVAGTGSGQIAVIPFAELTLNLNEPVPRFVMVEILLVVDEADRREVGRRVEHHKPILRDWLISNVSDKKLSEIQGREGQNALRREIHKFFNDQVSGGGPELIREIIFGKFNTQ